MCWYLHQFAQDCKNCNHCLGMKWATIVCLWTNNAMGSPTSVLLSLSLKSCCNTSSYVDTATQTLFWLRLFVCSSLRVFSRQIIMSEQLRKFEEPLKTDLEELLGRFQRTTSVRYEDFSSMWRDMKFGDIFQWGCYSFYFELHITLFMFFCT